MNPRRRFALVYNASAGIALPRLLDGVVSYLRASEAEVFQLPARSAAEAAARVRDAAVSESCDAVLSAGGDGTFRAVATGAAGTALPVGVIPLGTGNVIAAELGLPRRAASLAHILKAGPAIEIQGGLVNDAPFFLMCGAGFDARIVSRLNYATKRAVGRLAYSRPIIDTIRERPQSFDVAVDGKAMRASWVVVTLAQRYGGTFVLSRETGLGASKMVAVLIDAVTRKDLATAALALAAGRLAEDGRRPKFVSVSPANEVEIAPRFAVPVQIDGDAAGETPVAVKRGGPRVRVIVPPAYRVPSRC